MTKNHKENQKLVTHFIKLIRTLKNIGKKKAPTVSKGF